MTELTEHSDLRLSAVMPAALKVVHAALTDAAALRVWLAEHAEVTLPDRFQFWGRHTPDGAEPRQRVLSADERGLRLAWTVGGVETTVEITLTEHEAGADGTESTLLTLTQTDLPTFAEVLSDMAGPRGELQTFWTLALENLHDHLAGRELTPKCDYTSLQLQGSVVIDATPQAVFDALTQSDRYTRWSGVRVDIEPRVDGRFAMGGFDLDPSGGVRFVEFEPGRRASLRFPDGLTSTWELEGSGGRTRLTFVQSGFDVENPPYPGWSGWLSGLAAVRRYLEVPGFRRIWRQYEAPGIPAGMFAIDD
ncbi:SRPBCC domain-containing protein [Dactylosporangium sp. NPDC006015]|uniref:SRPBCC family protein n=1 Tax=Dactylosporangium sp. NPDC006015 TaxID=3154576 RepID=UPI00339F3563